MPSPPSIETKGELRLYWRQVRRDVTGEHRAEASRRICQRIVQSAVFEEATDVAAYSPLSDEVDIGPLLHEAVAKGKQVWLPRVSGEHMVFARFDPGTPLERTALGTLQPAPEAAVKRTERLDLVLLPLLAFSRSGWRLGMGGGYYDRAFSFMLSPRLRSAPVLVGVALSEQEAPELPCDPWDVPLQHVATQQEWIDCG